MADESDTKTETSATSNPPRRRAPRTTKPKTEAAKPATAKSQPATKRARSPAATSTAPSEAKPAAKSAAKRAPAKQRAAKRATPAPKRRKGQASTVEKATDKVGRKWNAAAIAGGVAAVGAGVAALLLRGSSKKPPEPVAPGRDEPVGVRPSKAHTADGIDATKSFQAGIADENSIPDA